MRSVVSPKLGECRVKHGRYGSTPLDGFNGAFFIPGPRGALLKVIASDGLDKDLGEGWEHVSVSVKNRTPNWAEMCFVKELFFDDEEVVVQFHPKKSEYVNGHPRCLHLFRSINQEFPRPPSILVGPMGGDHDD